MSKKIIAGVVGDVTAYAYAKAGGYTGTEEEFQALMAANVEAAKYADEVRAAAAAANEDKEAAAESKDAAAASQADAATSKAAAETAANYARTYTGAPRVAATAAAMTDQSLIYVYTGSETGYTAGNWYFWDGTTWTSGGVYNSTALETDETLTVSGAAADAKVTGDEIGALKSALNDTDSNLRKIYDDGQLLTITAQEMLHPTGDGTFTFDGETITYAEVTNQQNVIGFSFDSEIGKQYTVSCKINFSSGTIGLYAVKGTSVSTTVYLGKIDPVESSGTYSFNFTATTTTSTFWIIFQSAVNSAVVEDIVCSDGWGYKHLDTALTSEKFPAQGKAVGDAIAVIDGNVDSLEDRCDALDTAVSRVYTENDVHYINQDNYDLIAGNPTITYSGHGVKSVSNDNVNVVFGYTFDTVPGSNYTIKAAVGTGPIYEINISKNTSSASSESALASASNVQDETVTLTFTAQNAQSSIWFTQKNNVSEIVVEDVWSDGDWGYNNLDATLTKTDRPAQAKAVGDKLIGVPPAEWLGYINHFAITAADLVTDVGTVTRTITGNNITLANTGGTNSLTAYRIPGLTFGKDYTIEFDSETDFTASNQVARITINATASSPGDTYAEFTKNGNHYSCTFKAMDYAQYLALPTKYNSLSVTVENIMIRTASVIQPDNTYCNYNGLDITTFNAIVCIGDSLTYGGFNADDVDPDVGIEVLANKYSYPTYLEKISGINVDKIATGGVTSVGWWTAYQNTDTSGHDAAIIQLGVNDASPSKLNGWTQASIDAFTNIINKLKTENKGIKIFVATTIPSPSYRSANIDAVNDGIRALVEDLADDDVILCDINVYGHTGDALGYNAGHLTAYGYNQLARDYIALISYIMSQDKDNYRFIQFIGTNYTYSG